MILPLQQAVRAALQDTLTTLYGHAVVPATLVIETPPTRALGDLALPVRLRARAHPAQGAARHRAGDRRRARRRSTASPASRPRPTATQLLPRPRRRSCAATSARRSRRPRTERGRRPSSSTPPSTRTRPRTSATCATRRSATRSCACCASGARRSRSRTTSTTPASRSPTSSSASAPRRQAPRRRARARRPATRFDYYCWDLYARVTEWYDGDKDAARRSARRRCTPSSTAATPRPRWARSSPTASSAATCETMARLNIDYDLLTWEGDILRCSSGPRPSTS